MVHIKEITVGNLFTAGVMTEYTEVISMEFDRRDGYLINKSIPISHLNPIPLSLEILEKCGFDGNSHPKRRFKRMDGVLTLYFENGVFTMEDEDYFQNNMPHIKSLHQLQNLYYALTNEELEIKL